MSGSWRTSIMGALAVLTAVVNAATAIFDGNPSTVFDWDTTAAAVAAGIGLMFSRDNKVSSEEAGAKGAK